MVVPPLGLGFRFGVATATAVAPEAGGGGGGGGGGKGIGGNGGVKTTAERRPTIGVRDAAGSTTLTTCGVGAGAAGKGGCAFGCVMRTTGIDWGGGGGGTAAAAATTGGVGISNGITSSHISVTSSS